MHSRGLAIAILAGKLGGPFLEEGARAELIVCADGGAEHARTAGIPSTAIVGDLDSVSSETRNFFAERGAEIITVLDQDHNDFEKALDYLGTKWDGEVHVYGMTGGRLDHTLSNLSIMLRYTGRFRDLVAIDETAEYWFLTEGKKRRSFECRVDTTISLVPFGEANGIVTQNLLYPLREEFLRMGTREGLSNRATGSPVTIAIESGALLVVVSRD